jgi:hypothetical protein
MVKPDWLNPSRGGKAASRRARDWPLWSMLSGTLLLPGKAPIDASPHGAGSDVLGTCSTNRDVSSNVGIAYVP